MGKMIRSRTMDKTKFRELGKAGASFPMLPEGKTEFEDWAAVQYNGPLTALVCGDIHAPFYNRPAIIAAIERAKKAGVDFILLNGDTLDCHAISRWETDPRKRNFAGEVESVRSVLTTFRAEFPDAKIVFKMGNHEERYQSYMQVKCAEFLDVDDFQFEKLLRFEENNIEMVTDRRPIRLGQLNVLHGHEYRFSMSNPVNPSRGMFLRGCAHALVSHFHQTSQHSQNTLEDDSISCWSTGALCDMHPNYMPLNKWNLGAAIVGINADGGFEVDNFRIVKGKDYK